MVWTQHPKQIMLVTIMVRLMCPPMVSTLFVPTRMPAIIIWVSTWSCKVVHSTRDRTDKPCYNLILRPLLPYPDTVPMFMLKKINLFQENLKLIRMVPVVSLHLMFVVILTRPVDHGQLFKDESIIPSVLILHLRDTSMVSMVAVVQTTLGM